jgi:hypothetical protein
MTQRGKKSKFNLFIRWIKLESNYFQALSSYFGIKSKLQLLKYSNDKEDYLRMNIQRWKVYLQPK